MGKKKNVFHPTLMWQHKGGPGWMPCATSGH